MWRLRQALYSFMYGRYGVDKLYWALMAVWLLLSVINIFAGSIYIYILELMVSGFAFFRVLSRNIYRRSAENSKFLKICSAIKQRIGLFVKRIKEIGKKRYRRCRHCKAVLRLPIKRGRNSVRCPRCGRDFKVTIII